MTYEIYVNNNLAATEYTIEYVMKYIIKNGLEIVNEEENTDANTVRINCAKQEVKQYEYSI